MSVEIQPVRIIEASACNCAYSRQRLHRPRYSVTAGGAKLHAQPSLGFVRTVFIGIQVATEEFDILITEENADAERATGTTLTETAVAHAGAYRSGSRKGASLGITVLRDCAFTETVGRYVKT
jgi:hypothetical protein